ncbi:MAG: hypothetical protein KIT22_20310, partial [Verrucomicrobiae bacterium]|nr:hypothetical protein [Verrucomicrobiae bacterium]
KPRAEPPGLPRLREQARELALASQAPRPILLGRHLLERGLVPGPAFRQLLEAAFEAQLDGAFGDLDGARHWLEARLASDGAVVRSGESPCDQSPAP